MDDDALHSHHHLAGESGNFFGELLRVYTPRRQCMNFEPEVVWLHILSDSFIALAYFSIPISLIYFVRHRKDLAFNWIFMMFALFILLCGTTHAFGVWAIWQPFYRLDGLVKAATAIVSLVTAALLWNLVPKAVALPSAEQLRIMNRELENEIFEREKVQGEMKDLQIELERRVDQRTEELTEANRIKDMFLATLSHELRTPLNAIYGWTQLLLRKDVKETDPVKIRKGLEIIERNSKVQEQLIRDLLDVSRIISGKLQLEVESIDPVVLIDTAIDSVSQAINAKRIKLNKQLDVYGEEITVDPARFQQIIWNLLVNAVKFTPDGGTIAIGATRKGQVLEITVSDDGAGINPEFLPHLFERFSQADPSTTRAQGGLGIGLAIVRHLVEAHGGTVKAESEGIGRGATFTVELPVVKSGLSGLLTEEANRDKKGKAEAVILSSVNILVVEDEVDARELINEILSEAGAKVTSVSSAEEGLEALKRSRQDLIVSDIGMQGVDGYSFITRVRQSDMHARQIPAIALTAFARPQDSQHAIDAGFNLHLAKPINSEALLVAIQKLIDEKKREK